MQSRKAPASSRLPERPDLQFIPLSTDEGKIRFFGNLMPALLLLKESPRTFFSFQIQRHRTPDQDPASFIAQGADDVARTGDILVFVHRWRTTAFDPLTFARSRLFLEQLTRLLRQADYRAEPLDPLSPRINLPSLAVESGLGNLSPYGLLVHPVFGPRLILSALRTDYPLGVAPRFHGEACFDCMACIVLCPQKPHLSGVVDLGQCKTCAKCFVVCPVGKGRQARQALQAAGLIERNSIS